ncbi:hypothetical protein BJX66DRAFT_209440 [Aspergillus keveii]|uniref:Uncharacterized protein n=1 Tax=Aspergillus keveii TaxID=714993 RepID=A0ABR4GLK0_9EURO
MGPETDRCLQLSACLLLIGLMTMAQSQADSVIQEARRCLESSIHTRKQKTGRCVRCDISPSLEMAYQVRERYNARGLGDHLKSCWSACLSACLPALTGTFEAQLDKIIQARRLLVHFLCTKRKAKAIRWM